MARTNNYNFYSISFLSDSAFNTLLEQAFNLLLTWRKISASNIWRILLDTDRACSETTRSPVKKVHHKPTTRINETYGFVTKQR